MGNVRKMTEDDWEALFAFLRQSYEEIVDGSGYGMIVLSVSAGFLKNVRVERSLRFCRDVTEDPG
jgi:hypothetical protein